MHLNERSSCIAIHVRQCGMKHILPIVQVVCKTIHRLQKHRTFQCIEIHFKTKHYSMSKAHSSWETSEKKLLHIIHINYVYDVNIFY